MKIPPFRLTLLLAGLTAVTTVAAEKRATFLPDDKPAIEQILSGPSAPGSIETQREIEMVLAIQPTRTAADVARIKREGKLSPFLFDDVLGPWFTQENLPLTAALLETAGQDAAHLGETGKKFWSRPRPPLQDKRVKPSVGLPTNGSYPSGHGICGLVWGSLLAELAPDLRNVLIKRGEEIGNDRVLGGVHFPSDVEAGRTLARTVLAQFAANPTFRASVESARVEFNRVRSRAQGSDAGATPAHASPVKK